jgi:Uma2 family endonuclease
MVIREQSMTVEEFWEVYAEKTYELVGGRVVEVPASGFVATITARRIAARLGDFVDAHDLGDVTSADGGFMLSPHDLRIPDAAFISKAKIQKLTDPNKFIPFPPDLAVEVVSPTNLASEIREKIDLYFAAGTQLVWIVYPELRKVDVHFPDGTARTIDEAGTLDGGDVLPGLQIAVSAIFPAAE